MYIIDTLDTEITNRCNAACPLCPRTGTFNGLAEFMDRSGPLDVDPKIFDKIFTSEKGKNIKRVTYCGNYGDPCVHPQAMEIFKKCESYGVTLQKIDSNASMRNPSWWAELGSIKGMEVNFAIDGLEDTNHLYRVNTKWDKIMANAEAFIKAGGIAHWVFIVFKHNEHQVEQARELSRKMGFKRFASKETVRQYLPDVPLENQGHYDLAGNLYKKSSKHEEKRTIYSLPESKRYQPEMLRYGYKESPIVCRSEDKKQMFLTSDERIIPCCHVQEFFTIKDYHPERINQEPKYQGYEIDVFYKQFGVLSDLNKNTFDEIVDSYMEAYPYLEYMWQERKMARCNKKCGSNFRNVSRYQEN